MTASTPSIVHSEGEEQMLKKSIYSFTDFSKEINYVKYKFSHGTFVVVVFQNKSFGKLVHLCMFCYKSRVSSDQSQ